MAVSKAQQKAQNKWIAKAYDRINLTVPKGQKDGIQAHAAARSESVNGFIGRAIMEAMERDSAGGPQEAVGAVAVAGGVSLSTDALEAAQRAAGRTGESVQEFIERAIDTQDEQDMTSLDRGYNPVTGRSEGGADHE